MAHPRGRASPHTLVATLIAMEMLPAAFASGWASGINAWGTVLVLGVLGRFAGIEGIPAGFQRTDVLIIVAVLCAIELVADKIPYIDSAWDTISTVIRPIAGAAIGAIYAGATGDLATITLASVGGITALVSHLTKASIRLAVNTSPEPVSNIGASMAEDTAVITATALAVTVVNPVVIAVVVAVLLIAGGPGRLRGFIGQDLPHHDRQVLEIVGRQPANRHIRDAVIVQVRVPVVGRDLWRRLPTHVDFRGRQERRYTSGAETRVEGSGRFGIANQQDELQLAAARMLANVGPNLLGTERARDERESMPLGRPMGQPRSQRLQVDGRTDHHRVQLGDLGDILRRQVIVVFVGDEDHVGGAAGAELPGVDVDGGTAIQPKAGVTEPMYTLEHGSPSWRQCYSRERATVRTAVIVARPRRPRKAGAGPRSPG